MVEVKGDGIGGCVVGVVGWLIGFLDGLLRGGVGSLLGHWRDDGLGSVLDAVMVRWLVMDGWSCGVTVVMGWIKGDVGCSVVGECFVEHLLGLSLGIA